MQNHQNPIKKIAPVAVTAFVAAMLVGAFSFTTTAYAAVTFDSGSGTGFVGKGDVQEAFDWNNKQLQQNAPGVSFEFVSTTISEREWTCTNNNNQNEQVRERTTTTTTTGLVDSIARERNQITGFNLQGFSGEPTESSTTEGPPVNSCPSGPWTLTTPAGDPEVISEESTVIAVFGEDRVELN
jgi:hypothetical protein